jgi:translation initiation factor 2 subunit 1
VSDRDDRLLTEQMLDLERANQEVAGDDDSEEEEVGMGGIDVETPAVMA